MNVYDGPPGKTQKRVDWLAGKIQQLHEHMNKLDHDLKTGRLDDEGYANLIASTWKSIREHEYERDEIVAYLAAQPPRPWWQFWGDAQDGEVDRPAMDREGKRFRRGQPVFHQRFGDGVVLGVRDRTDDCEVAIAFKRHGTKHMVVPLVPSSGGEEEVISVFDMKMKTMVTPRVAPRSNARSVKRPTSVTPPAAPQSNVKGEQQSSSAHNIVDDVCETLQDALYKLHPDDYETVYAETLAEVAKANSLSHDEYQRMNAGILINSGVVQYIHNRVQNGDSVIAAIEALRNAFQSLSIEVTKSRKHLYPDYLATQHWAEQKTRALERAKYSCQLCRSKSTLEVHHNTYERLWQEDPNDLIVLCRACHSKHHDRMNQDTTNRLI